MMSVYTSCDILGRAVFGPYDLKHTSLVDIIVLIAMKSTDRRTAPYMLRVDTSLASTSKESPRWLPLVQTARNAKEQNLEAFVEDGQLFFRTLRNIRKDAELLVWYGKELAELLSISSASRRSVGLPFVCSACSQCFLFEYPFLVHQRFLCAEAYSGFNYRKADISNHLNTDLLLCSKHTKSKSLLPWNKPTADFHNLARDLENNRGTPPQEILDMSITKRGHILESEVYESDGENPDLKLSDNGKVKKFYARNTTGQLSSAFCAVQKSQQSPGYSPETHRGDSRNQDCKSCGEMVKLTDLWGISRSDEGRKSAFIQPPRSIPQISQLMMSARIGVRNAVFPSFLTQTNIQTSKLQNSVMLHGSVLKQGDLLCNRQRSPKTSRVHQSWVSSVRSLPPPSLSRLCLPGQNWCAKCNIIFHTTSGLVRHMRLHHKRALSGERSMEQSRKEQLRCPVCKDPFKEHHHLSRHMTSHV